MDYTGAILSAFPSGTVESLQALKLDPSGWPLPSTAELHVCLKTRLNPPQQLSQIRLQISAEGDVLGAGGRHGGLQQVQT